MTIHITRPDTTTDWVVCYGCDGIGAVPVILPDGTPASRLCDDCHPPELDGDPHPSVQARAEGWSWPHDEWTRHIGVRTLDDVWDRIQREGVR